jgi:hypothetical protein
VCVCDIMGVFLKRKDGVGWDGREDRVLVEVEMEMDIK